MARITVATVGSRGDVQPYAALARGLVDAGHDVCLATHGTFRDWISDQGIEYFEMSGDPQDMIMGGQAREWIDSGTNPLKFFLELRKLMRPVLVDAVVQTRRAAQGSDFLVGSSLLYLAAHAAAEDLGIPWAQTYLQPVHPTGEFASAMAMPGHDYGRWINLATHVISGQLYWHMLRTGHQEARAALGLAPTAFMGPFLQIERQGVLGLYGLSPSVIPKPDDWPEHVHVTGYWFLAEDDVVPDEVRAFLEAGPPPVYVGFGSMSTADPEATVRTVLAGLEAAGARGILLGGWKGLGDVALPEKVMRTERVSHRWLFPRVRAVVHHGGAGTTAAGLRAGVPSIVVPFFADQPFWADRVRDLGVGPDPIPRAELTAQRLADAIAATDDPDMRARAAALGAQIRGEDGVGRAVELIEAELTRAGLEQQSEDQT